VVLVRLEVWAVKVILWFVGILTCWNVTTGAQFYFQKHIFYKHLSLSKYATYVYKIC
jgi:hypothetical protein